MAAPVARTAVPSRARASSPNTIRRTGPGSTTSALSTGSRGRSYAAHTPAAAEPAATSGRHTVTHDQEGCSSPPEQYSATAPPTPR